MVENFKAFGELDDNQYLNEYVVIVKGKVVAHGQDAEKLLSEVKRQFSGETPLIAKIPSQEILVL